MRHQNLKFTAWSHQHTHKRPTHTNRADQSHTVKHKHKHAHTLSMTHQEHTHANRHPGSLPDESPQFVGPVNGYLRQTGTFALTTTIICHCPWPVPLCAERVGKGAPDTPSVRRLLVGEYRQDLPHRSSHPFCCSCAFSGAVRVLPALLVRGKNPGQPNVLRGVPCSGKVQTSKSKNIPVQTNDTRRKIPTSFGKVLMR